MTHSLTSTFVRRAGSAIVALGTALALTVATGPIASAAPVRSAPAAVATAKVAPAAVKPAPPKPGVIRAVRQATMDQQMVAEVNRERVRAGVAPLVVSTGVTTTASYWSSQMVAGKTGGQLQHNPNFVTMILAHEKHRIRAFGENVAAFTAGAYSAADIVGMYMASPGHRANILNPRYRYVGIVTVQKGPGTAFNTMNFAG